MSAPVRIVVADDHNLFRAGVIELIESVPEFHVLADAATGAEAISKVVEVKPDVLVLDVEMPGPGVVGTIHKVIEASPSTKVVVLTMHDDPDLVQSVFEAGAAGYLLKSAGRSELVAAISTACRGEGSVLLAVSRTTMMSLSRASAPDSTPGLLSPREIEIVALVASAKGNRDIAAALYISEGTVKRHLANIYHKLGATSRIDAVRKTVALGIIANTFTSDSAANL